MRFIYLSFGKGSAVGWYCPHPLCVSVTSAWFLLNCATFYHLDKEVRWVQITAAQWCLARIRTVRSVCISRELAVKTGGSPKGGSSRRQGWARDVTCVSARLHFSCCHISSQSHISKVCLTKLCLVANPTLFSAAVLLKERGWGGTYLKFTMDAFPVNLFFSFIVQFTRERDTSTVVIVPR